MKRLTLLLLLGPVGPVCLFAQTNGTVTGTVKVVNARTPANVVVYLEQQGEALPLEPPKQPVILDQKGKQFIPHVLPVVKGTRVTFFNSDAVLHNVHAHESGEELFNLGLPQDAKSTRKFNQPGEVVLLCDIHPEMSGYILVLETPYFGVTDAEGRFSIANVPQGDYVLKTWHEAKAALKQTIAVTGAEPVTVSLTLQKAR